MTLKEIGIIADTRMVKTKTEDYWTVSFWGVEVKEGGLLKGSYGTGRTITEAKEDYAKQLCRQVIVKNAMKSDRREFQLPPKITNK